jgi:hypothetical protein
MGAFVKGTRVHERHGWQVSVARGVRRLALALLGIAAVALLVWGITSLL